MSDGNIHHELLQAATGPPINHCKLKLGLFTYNKVTAQSFLDANSIAVMSKVIQHHTSL